MLRVQFLRGVVLFLYLVLEGGKLMLIKVNGKEEEINEEITILQYLENKGVNPENIVIQYNGEIIDGEDVDELILVANDNLEVLKFVGGG